jgi:predicted ribosomally synthesized peptide with SipW-like signal peptide
MSRARKILVSLIVVSLASIAIAGATFAKFSRTTSNPGNSFAAGTVNIADNDAGAAFSIPTMSPGSSASRCIRVTYTGSLTSNVHLFGATTGSLAPYLNLVVTRGTESAPSFPSCSTFTADATNYIGSGAGVVYSGTLSNFASTYSDYASGLVDVPTGAQNWATNNSHSYQFTVSLPAGASSSAQGLTSGATFYWEARNT